MDDISEDSDDIFNDKVTERLDELNKSEAKKSSALDQLASPENFTAIIQGEQGTGPTTGSSGLTANESGKTVQQTTMIDTCNGGPTKAFDAGVQNGDKQRIDLSDMIDDGTKEVAAPLQQAV